MIRKTSIALIALVAGSIAIAQPAKETKPATKTTSAQPATDHALPPGMTPEEMQACMIAGTPGEQHKFLAECAGEWAAKTTMWMAPGAEPMKCDGVSTVTSIMDGRFTKVEMSGEMPGMGPYTGIGTFGYDNAAGKYVATWICNMGTNIMVGTGEVSSDKRTITWTYDYVCPVTKKLSSMRDVEHRIDKNNMKIESFAKDIKTGKEFKMMEIVLTRKQGGKPSAGAH